MIKKLHNYLLEHYPLIWNLRLVNMLVVLAFFHLLHFATGYSRYAGNDSIGWYNPGRMYFNTSFSLFSIIGSCLIFILWLIRVFRNNAFKSFYPLRSGRLFTEFMLLFLTCLLLISGYYSYTYGYVFHVRGNTNRAVNEKDIALYNTMAVLLQEGTTAYNIEKRCSPAPFPLSKRYKSNTPGDNTVRAAHEDYYYVAQDGKAFTVRQVDSMSGGYEYSYLNFCNTYLLVSPEERDASRIPESDDYKKELTLLLHNPRALKERMNAFLKLCDKYNIAYRLSADDWFTWVYNPPYFPVAHTIYHKNYVSSRYASGRSDDALTEDAMRLNPKAYYIEIQRLQRILQSIQKAHAYHFDFSLFCGFLYGALSIALMVFTFRATARSVWMITLIGSALLAVIIGALTAILAMNDAIESAFFLYLLVIIGFCLVHFCSSNKTISGVALNWFAWSLPLVPVVIFGFAGQSDHSVSIATGLKEPGLDYWLRHNTTFYFFICLLLYLVVLRLVLAPRYRRWQGMPEQ